MFTFFLAAAFIGGAILVAQMVLSLFGHHADTDVDAGGGVEHGDAYWSGALSLRALSAAVTIFGLTGLLSLSLGATIVTAVAIALLAGAAAMLVVAASVGALLKLADDGTFRIEDAIGATGTVYIGIPPAGQGLGKIHVPLQGRTVELEAAADRAIASGTAVIVSAVVGPGRVEVVESELPVAV